MTIEKEDICWNYLTSLIEASADFREALLNEIDNYEPASEDEKEEILDRFWRAIGWMRRGFPPELSAVSESYLYSDHIISEARAYVEAEHPDLTGDEQDAAVAEVDEFIRYCTRWSHI